MYGKTAAGAGGAATLPLTGLNAGWMILAAVMLIAVGAALWRLTPRREE
jgi:LPXTG-motif cell wall-anchored protein